MPGKSRQSRRKKQLRDKKTRGAPVSPTVTVRQEAVAQQGEPVTRSRTVTSAVASVPVMPRYPYITSELKRIGIVAAIMLVVLVVLSVVLS